MGETGLEGGGGKVKVVVVKAGWVEWDERWY